MTYYKIIIVFLAGSLLPLHYLEAQDDACRPPFNGIFQSAQTYQVTNNEAVNGNGIELLTATCLRQKGNREYPYPTEKHHVITNPPIFTWPMVDYEYPTTFPSQLPDKELDEYLQYDIQLGRKADFTDKNSILKTGLRLAFYNPHHAMQPGTWYWRYRVSGEKWSETFSVNIPEDAPLFESPNAETALQMLPETHPMLFKPYLLNNPLTNDQTQLLKLLRKKAKTALAKKLESYKVKGHPIPSNASESKRKQIMRFHLRYEVEAICSNIENLLNIYLIDGEERYLNKAIVLADHIADRNPIETYSISDFTGAKCMSTLAMVYDIAYNRLVHKQKSRYENFISDVATRIIAHALQENIGSADGILYAHFFQHTFCNVFNTVIIMKQHLPLAEIWFQMLYDIWLSRSPGGGFLADGVWPNGNIGYIHVNMESMVSNFLLFRDLFGVNIFRHPWYANWADALAYTVPIGSAGDGFGDDCDQVYVKNTLRPDFAYILGQELNNPFALHYAYRFSGQPEGTSYRFHKTNFTNYRLQHHPQAKAYDQACVPPQSAVFPQTGIVVMNTDVLHTDSNLFVSFRSSPFGVGSHGLAEQNSFNLSYKGTPVFYPIGYKITTADKHYLLSQKHSRAHNTLTVDGKTQAYSHSAYGWIARYLDGKDITYTLGDASRAYIPFDQSAINWITVLEAADAYTAENGFILKPEDNPQVRLFRRHLALLRPNILVVYDELEADKEVTWTFQLNGLERSCMKINPSGSLLTADTDNCDAQANIFGSQPLRSSLADTCYVKPFDWLNPQRGRPAKVFEQHQYHAAFENIQKSKKMRFLALIQIDETNSMTFADVTPDDDGSITLGNYRIKGELDTSREGRLEIENIQSGEYLLYGPTETSVRSTGRRYSHSTLLYHPDKGLQESIDRHPLMRP